MKQSQKLDALIKRILKEELGSIKEESKINYKKISDEEAVKILNNKNNHIETTIDYDRGYRDPADEILASSNIKADAFDNIGVKERGHPFKEIRLSVYKPSATNPFFLIRNIGNSSWTMGEFDLGKTANEDKIYITQDGTEKSATPDQRKDMRTRKAGETVTTKKAGLEENDTKEPDMEQQPTGTEIAGQVAEIVEKLKSMSEGGKDPKKQKLAVRAMKQMESAKAALEALTAHETMLEEKDQVEQEKKASKHRDRIEKIFKGIVKDENIVNRLKDKLSTKDIAALSKKLGEKGKELDEEKLARIVLNRSLKEGWDSKKKL
jgi:hypothetical protein